MSAGADVSLCDINANFSTIRRAGRRPLVRDLSGVGADLSAICREPAAKPVHVVHLVQPR
ncbi:hypothetical protein KPSA1_04134 [Pseudomonas syringae pv. actinidiae]|uniref:Uncharacterized protein n=1 Tax=Pseudomonas syringae pv. actinidiae TaxID=103796 RepID=A0A2V0QNA8_PSESF|nr:hypothetical protein KPSA1_04134 [Pseudomonas syringae pv. actinidiae]